MTETQFDFLFTIITNTNFLFALAVPSAQVSVVNQLPRVILNSIFFVFLKSTINEFVSRSNSNSLSFGLH